MLTEQDVDEGAWPTFVNLFVHTASRIAWERGLEAVRQNLATKPSVEQWRALRTYFPPSSFTHRTHSKSSIGAPDREPPC